MCVPVCNGSCDDGLTTALSVNTCKHLNLHPISNKTDVHQITFLSTTLHKRDRDRHSVHVNHDNKLHQACEEGRLCTVQFILSHRPTDINTRDKLGRTPIMAAVMRRRVAVFDYLVSQNCDLLAVDNNNDTVLHVACDVGNADIVRKLVVNQTCDVESRGWKGMTPVMKAALQGHRDVFDLLVSKGVNVATVDDYMNNILHVACSGGHVDMVKYVLRNFQSDIERRGEKGRTPLMIDSLGQYGRTPVMISAYFGHKSIFIFLVNQGCNLMILDVNKNNILHVSCESGSVSIVKYILSHTKISKESRNRYGKTPVMSAVINGHLKLVKYLTSKGCKVMITDKYKNNILHMACEIGSVNVVKYILSHLNIAIDSTGCNGRTPVMSAAMKGYLNVIKYLVSKGCKVTRVDYDKNNVLHVAIINGHMDIVKYILTNTNIAINSKGRQRRTPLIFAAHYGRTSIVKYLVHRGAKVSLVDSQRNNFLHMACISGNVDTVDFIVSQTNVAIESREKYRKTPLMLAVMYGHTSVVKYLVEKGCNINVVDKTGKTVLERACATRCKELITYLMSIKKWSTTCNPDQYV